MRLEMKRIGLKSSDGETIEVSEAEAMQSEVIKNYVEDSERSEMVIPVGNVRGNTLRKVIEWMRKKQSESTAEEMGEWEKRYVDVDLDFMYHLIMAANYLAVTPLLHRCCQKLADLIAGKSPEQIRHIFGIHNDYTPEEEAHLRSQNAWEFHPRPQPESNTASGSGSNPNPNP